jgi:hypothetical protein
MGGNIPDAWQEQMSRQEAARSFGKFPATRGKEMGAGTTIRSVTHHGVSLA